MKNYTIQKKYEKNGTVLDFRFDGQLKNSNLSLIGVETLLDKYFEKLETYNDIYFILKWFKKSFEDFADDYLQLLISENGKEIQVELKNKQLIYFESNENLDENRTLNCIYSVPFNFHSRILGKDLNKDETSKIYKVRTNDILQQIFELENIFVIEFSEQQKKICKIYKLYYGENPDFGKRDISIKIQTMLCILAGFSISLGYSFSNKNYDNNLQYSIDLQSEICGITMLSDLANCLFKETEKLEMNELEQRKIKIIGEFVREYTKDNLANLIKLSSVIYAINHLSEIAEPEEVKKIADSSCYSTESIEESIKLIRKIHNQLEETTE